MNAQNAQYSLKGKVTDEENEVIYNANIQIIARDNSYSTGAYTNDTGVFTIQRIPEGNYQLIISAIGYTRKEIVIEINQDKEISIALHSQISALDDVLISGNANENYNTRNPSSSLKLDQELIKIPQNIQVITNDVLQDQATISMLENITRNVSGTQMIEHWGNFARINMRGFRVPPFRNGMNVLSTWGPLEEDLALVDRIEFVKGPSAFMLSSGEPGGLYNVVTKKPINKSFGEVSLITGSYNTLRASIDKGGFLSKDHKLQYRFVGAGSTKKSHRDYEFNDRYTFAPSLTYQIDDKTSITGQYTFQYSKLSLIGNAYVFAPSDFGSLDSDFTLADPRLEPTKMKEHYGFLNFEHELDEDWTLTAQISYLNYTQEGSSLWFDSAGFGISEKGDLIRTTSSFDAHDEMKLGQVFVTGFEQTGGITHRIIAGLDYGDKYFMADWNQEFKLDTEEQPFNIYNPTPAVNLPDFDRSENLRKRAGFNIISSEYLSYYLQDELGFFDDKLALTLAARLTNYKSNTYSQTTDDQVVSPRASVRYSFTDNISVYGMFDQSFLPQTGFDYEGDMLDPVEADDIEGGVKIQWFDGKLSGTATYFHITKNNMTTSRSQQPNDIYQLGEVTSKGFEFDLRGQIASNLNIILNYSNTTVEITEDLNPNLVGNRVAGHAKHISNAWLNYNFNKQFIDGLGVSLGYQYQVDRSSWSWGSDGQTDLPDYFRMDGALSWQNDRFKVALNINNLLNEYLYSGADYGSYVYWQSEPGRNFRLSLNYKF